MDKIDGSRNAKLEKYRQRSEILHKKEPSNISTKEIALDQTEVPDFPKEKKISAREHTKPQIHSKSSLSLCSTSLKNNSRRRALQGKNDIAKIPTAAERIMNLKKRRADALEEIDSRRNFLLDRAERREIEDMEIINSVVSKIDRHGSMVADSGVCHVRKTVPHRERAIDEHQLMIEESVARQQRQNTKYNAKK